MRKTLLCLLFILSAAPGTALAAESLDVPIVREGCGTNADFQMLMENAENIFAYQAEAGSFNKKKDTLTLYKMPGIVSDSHWQWPIKFEKPLDTQQQLTLMDIQPYWVVFTEIRAHAGVAVQSATFYVARGQCYTLLPPAATTPDSLPQEAVDFFLMFDGMYSAYDTPQQRRNTFLLPLP